MKRSHLKALCALMLAAAPTALLAESTFVTGGGALNTNARLDFQITIPKILYLRVGTGGPFPATSTTVDLFALSVPAANLGDGTPLAFPGSAAVQVVGNNGNISLTATTLGALGNGSGDTISFTQIAGTSDNANLAHPAAFVDGGTSAGVTVTPNIGTKVVNRTANWSFAYANAAVVPPGVYGGINVNNSRVTYTASLP